MLITFRDSMSGCRCRRGNLRTTVNRRCHDEGGGPAVPGPGIDAGAGLTSPSGPAGLACASWRAWLDPCQAGPGNRPGVSARDQRKAALSQRGRRLQPTSPPSHGVRPQAQSPGRHSVLSRDWTPSAGHFQQLAGSITRSHTSRIPLVSSDHLDDNQLRTPGGGPLRVCSDVPGADLAYTWRVPSLYLAHPSNAVSARSSCRAGGSSVVLQLEPGHHPPAAPPPPPPGGQPRHQP
jgi:hypothetical protein